MELLFVAWLALALLGSYVAAQKGRGGAEGFFLGLLFGPLGVLVAALLPAGSAKAMRGRVRAGESWRDYRSLADDPVPPGWRPGDPIPSPARGRDDLVNPEWLRP